MDRGPGHLENALETAAALLGWNNLPKLFGKRKPVREVVIGEGDEAEENLVNLLDDRIRYSEEIELERGEPPSDASRYRALTNAFDLYRTEFRRRFPIRPHDKG